MNKNAYKYTINEELFLTKAGYCTPVTVWRLREME
jgi:hypothetical protein